MALSSENSLIFDPLIRVAGTVGQLTLPGLLAAFSRGDDPEALALQAHQFPSWHVFCVQLAALALSQAGLDSGPADEDKWRALLLALTDGTEEPWCLAVEDLAQPAFMQPPVPEMSLLTFKVKDRVASPSDLDILVTAKDHDVKAQRIRYPLADHWLFALVALQTFQGYSGARNYGVARMNSGFGNRPVVGFAPSSRQGPRFRRDLSALLGARDTLVDQYGYRRGGGAALLWCRPWDGAGTLSLTDCDPFFIEICRRVRAVRVGNQLVMCKRSSAAARMSAKDALGDTGDAWTPVARETGKAFTAAEAGFDYRRLHELLLTDVYSPGVAQVIKDSDGQTPVLLATALARGQGETNGFHARSISLPRPVRRLLTTSGGKARLRALSEQRLTDVTTMRRKVLHPALCALMQGAPEKLNLKDSRDGEHLSQLDRWVNDVFFTALWRDAEEEPARAAEGWQGELVARARDVLRRCVQRCSMPAARRYKSIAAAERTFEGAARRQFPAAFNQAPPAETA